MIISEVRFAAAILLANGEYRKFDDAGEMLEYQNEHADEQVEAIFVHDYFSESGFVGKRLSTWAVKTCRHRWVLELLLSRIEPKPRASLLSGTAKFNPWKICDQMLILTCKGQYLLGSRQI